MPNSCPSGYSTILLDGVERCVVLDSTNTPIWDTLLEAASPLTTDATGRCKAGYEFNDPICRNTNNPSDWYLADLIDDGSKSSNPFQSRSNNKKTNWAKITGWALVVGVIGFVLYKKGKIFKK